MRINSKSIITLLIAFLMIFGTAFNSYATPNTQIHLHTKGYVDVNNSIVFCYVVGNFPVEGATSVTINGVSATKLLMKANGGSGLFKSPDLGQNVDPEIIYFTINDNIYRIGQEVGYIGKESNGTVNYEVTSLPKYTLTYVGNGSTDGNAPAPATQYQAGTNVVVLGNIGNFAKTNYTFSGWNTVGDGSGIPYVAGSSLVMPFADVTLYAQWTESKFNVSYNSNGATAVNPELPDPTPYYQGQSFTIFNPTSLERGEDIFLGWEFGGLIYTPGSPFTMGNSDVVFTAVWQAKPPVTDPETPKYKVTYHENLGGVTTYEQTNILSGTSINLIGLPSGFNTTNKTFKGWSTLTSGPVDSPVGKNVTVTENLNFYAVWENDPTYKVYYYGNGNTFGSVPVDSKAYFKNDEASVLPIGDLAKTHFSFLGWSTNQAATSADYTDASKITITDHDVYLFAVWQPDKTYKVTYNANGGNGNVPEDFDNYYMESTATVLGKGDLDKPNHTFKGWKIGNEDKLYQAGNTLMITGDVTLMAVWEFVPPQETNPPTTNPPQETNPPTTQPPTTTEVPATTESEIVEIEEEVGAPAGAASSIVETTEELVELDEPGVPLGDALPKTGQLPVELFYGVGGLITAAGVYLRRKSS